MISCATITNSTPTNSFVNFLITNINLEFRTKLKGDITKALYRFFRSQKGMTYECHLLTLCKAINLDVTVETFRLRARIKKGFTELKKAGYLKKSMLMKSDIIKVWKAPKKGTCIIEDATRPKAAL